MCARVHNLEINAITVFAFVIKLLSLYTRMGMALTYDIVTHYQKYTYVSACVHAVMYQTNHHLKRVVSVSERHKGV